MSVVRTYSRKLYWDNLTFVIYLCDFVRASQWKILSAEDLLCKYVFSVGVHWFLLFCLIALYHGILLLKILGYFPLNTNILSLGLLLLSYFCVYNSQKTSSVTFCLYESILEREKYIVPQVLSKY